MKSDEEQARRVLPADSSLQASCTAEASGVNAESCAAGFCVRAVLRDGTPVCIRAIRPDDKERLRTGFKRLSPQSVYQRFLHPVAELTADNLRYLTELDFRNHVGLALMVEQDGKEQFIAVGRFVRSAPDADEAEVAFTVRDEYQHRGASTLLLRLLAEIARSCGVRQFVALVLAGNRSMLEVFEDSKLPMRQTFEGGTHCVVLSLDARR